MIHSNAKQAFFTTRPANPTHRIRTKKRVTAYRAELPLSVAPAMKKRNWIEDTFGLILLLAIAFTVIALSAVMVREFVEQMFRYEGVGLMRRFGGM